MIEKNVTQMLLILSSGMDATSWILANAEHFNKLWSGEIKLIGKDHNE